MLPYFTTIIKSQTNLKHINMSDSNLDVNFFKFISSKKNLKKFIFKGGSITQSNPLDETPLDEVMHQTFIQAIKTNPQLTLSLSESYVQNNDFIRKIGKTSFFSAISKLLSTLPDTILEMVFEYSDTIDNYLELSGEVFTEEE